MRYQFIDAQNASYSTASLCAFMGISCSGYYAWRKRPASTRQRKDMVLLAHIKDKFEASNRIYGARRIAAELSAEGMIAGRHRVARLMRDNTLKVERKKKFKRTTDSHHKKPVAPNLLEQDFTCTGPNQKWGADISYVWTTEGWLYLAIIVDLFSRRIVGWATSNRMKAELVTTALKRALATRTSLDGLIHHSDRGSQYCSDAYQRLLSRHNITPSMSGKGNCFDNSMVETVFKTIKAEMLWRTAFQTRQEAEKALGVYIEGFYNPTRRHSALGYQSPIVFERQKRNIEQKALHFS